MKPAPGETLAAFDPSLRQGWVQDDVIRADRSTLERWATCPAQAAIIESGQTLSSMAAKSGSEAHEVISATVTEWCDSDGSLTLRELHDFMMGHVLASRPDVQPDVIEALRRSSWTISKLLHENHPSSIMRWDGGEGERAGQLASDMEVDSRTVRVTGEMDLLCGSPSIEMVRLYDWKTGNKAWTVDDVNSSFQFAVYSWLVLRNYPGVQDVQVRVLNTRSGSVSHFVSTSRRYSYEPIEARIRSAARQMVRYGGRGGGGVPADPPAWPAAEKCRMCDAVLQCPVIRPMLDSPLVQIASDPESAVDVLVGFEAAAEAWRQHLAAVVDKRQDDVQGRLSGAWFGRRHPRSERKPSAKLYERD